MQKLRYIRIALAILVFLPILVYFLDFTGNVPKALHWFEKVQFVPALLSVNIILLVALILLTFVFGRVYCSVICPLGIWQDIIFRIRKYSSKKKIRFKYKLPMKLMRYGFLLIAFIAFIAGFHFVVGLLDPYSLFGRMTVQLFKPIYQAGNNLLAEMMTESSTWYKVGIYSVSLFSAIMALAGMAVVSVMSWINGRLYCNTVCPVGTLLGFVSKYALFKIHFDEEKCNSCASCARSCKSSCIDYKNMTVDHDRCVTCFNCLSACKQSGLTYGIPKKVKNIDEKGENNQGRRTFLMALGAGIATAPQLMAKSNKVIAQFIPIKRKTPIMPPGAKNLDHFNSKCTSCYLCVTKCPSQVIKPSFLEYGLSGMMQPTLHFGNGFCNYDCTDCGDVCPTGAIIPLTKADKNLTQMGQVHLDLHKCIVITDQTSCGACSEHCPTQAVSMIPYKGALTRPFIKPEICVGCGGCEYVCPAKPQKAIHVEGLSVQNRIKIEKKLQEKVKIDEFGF